MPDKKEDDSKTLGGSKQTAGAIRYLGKPLDTLSERERAIFDRLAARRTISTDVSQTFDDRLTRGQRLADLVAEFGGSWTFIMMFAVVLALWLGSNLMVASHSFDPYPFIFPQSDSLNAGRRASSCDHDEPEPPCGEGQD